jgi:hypothetical protein
VFTADQFKVKPSDRNAETLARDWIVAVAVASNLPMQSTALI